MFFPRFAICLALLCSGCVTANLPDSGPHHRYGIGKGLEQKLNHGQPLTRGEIVQLSASGMPPDEIIAHVRRGGGVYRLGQNEQGALLERGVDPAVVDYLSSTANIPKLKYGRGMSSSERESSIFGGPRLPTGEATPSSGLAPHVVTQRPDVVGQGVVTGQ